MADEGYLNGFGTGWERQPDHIRKWRCRNLARSSASFGGLSSLILILTSLRQSSVWEAVTTEPKQTFIGGAALFAMSGQSDEENAAPLAFFQYLTSPEVHVHVGTVKTGYVPVNRSGI